MKRDHIEGLPEDWLPAAKVFAAMGDPLRQKILLLFEETEEISIKKIAGALSAGRSTIVHHLTVLEEAGVLAFRRAGKETLYRARPETALAAMDRLREYIGLNFPSCRDV